MGVFFGEIFQAKSLGWHQFRCSENPETWFQPPGTTGNVWISKPQNRGKLNYQVVQEGVQHLHFRTLIEVEEIIQYSVYLDTFSDLLDLVVIGFLSTNGCDLSERADLQRSKYDRFAEELRPSVELSIIYTAYKNTQYALSPYLDSGENRHFFSKVK